jgi:hypothetical protein
MGAQVVNGAQIACSFGAVEPALIVEPTNRVASGGQPAATIMDFKPGVNIPPFGMCSSLGNEAVSTATAAANGVLTPMPCTPVTTPWKPGSETVLIAGQPALTNSSTCNCAFGGVITILMPGQETTTTA